MLDGYHLCLAATTFLLLSACDMKTEAPSAESGLQTVSMEPSGWLVSNMLNEASGLQASYSRHGDFFTHNDEGPSVIYAIDETGTDLGLVAIVPAVNRDWEDITSIPVKDERWLVVGDIGDNWANRKSIKLYFAEEPKPGENDRYAGMQELKHWLNLSYPDGPRDCESMAYDPIGQQLLLISKRDKPPRLYAVDLETALTQQQADLVYLGNISALRPPTPGDRHRWGARTEWISQPTGFDISPDGTEAVVITYRSLYRYVREPDEDWVSALQKKPQEVTGSPAIQNEAIAYSVDGKSIYVTTEKRPAPIYRFKFLHGSEF
jgi:hypothetical protein